MDRSTIKKIIITRLKSRVLRMGLSALLVFILKSKLGFELQDTEAYAIVDICLYALMVIAMIANPEKE